MAVKIRMKRVGTKNTPVFRIVVADSRSPLDGKCIEEIGTYQPLKQGENFSLKLDRAQYWVSKGAQPSDTVTGFILKEAVATGIGFIKKATSIGVRKLALRDQGRLDVLLAKNNEGTLSQKEQVELNHLAKKVHEITIRNAKELYGRREAGGQLSGEVAGSMMIGGMSHKAA
jgi:small subunit ribosomal protein S16